MVTVPVVALPLVTLPFVTLPSVASPTAWTTVFTVSNEGSEVLGVMVAESSGGAEMVEMGLEIGEMGDEIGDEIGAEIVTS